jgi:hypothetical protein
MIFVMENKYTETMLKPLKQVELLEIAAANEIEADESMKKADIIALILEKGCLVPADSGGNPPEGDGNDDGENDEDESVPKFSKEQLLQSNWYSHRRDALNSLLDDDKEYSHATVQKLIENFMKGKVN